MLTVNNEEIPVYKLDNRDSILERIAAILETLPVYLYDVPNSLQGKIKVGDLLKKIKKHASKSTDFEEFFNKFQTNLTKLDITNDVVKVWLVYNKVLETMIEQSGTVVFSAVGPFLIEQQYFETEDDLINFWRERKTFKKDFEYKIEKNRFESEKRTEMFKIFEEIEDGLAFTDLKIERIALALTLDLSDITLLEIFNNLLLSQKVPFAVCKNYYKILKDYTPAEEWSKLPPDGEMVVKVNDQVTIDTNKYKDYTDVKVKLVEQDVVAEMKILIEKGRVNQDEYIDRFLSSFAKGKITYKKISETEVAGTFYFPQERIDTYVFSDLVMNDDIFSALINIDESTKTTKKKSPTSQPWIYMHFNHFLTGHVTASVSQRIVNRAEAEMRLEDAEIFPHGQPYIRVRAKGKNKEAINNFQELFSKLLVIYGMKYNETVEEYKKFIPDFGIVEELEVPELKQSDIAPEIFVSNFSRYCGDARHPTIVSDKKAAKYTKKGQEVMVFPRDLDETRDVVYPSDGKNQYNYVCLNPEYPYPGLQANTKLANSEEYPYLPCCFKNRQSDKSGGFYRHYYFGEELETKEKKQQELIITDKILGSNKYGTLPDDVRKIFEVLDPETSYKYLRVGVDRNPSSFLQAVMLGLYEQTGIVDLDDERSRTKLLRKTRAELASNSYLSLAKQSCYDQTSEQIAANLKDDKYYLDPRMFVQMLETYFGCTIFVFNKDGLVLPRHLQNYYREASQGYRIFIYEHWGSEADNAKYPQCELIARWYVKKSDTDFFFNQSENISKNIERIFQLMNKSYVLNKPLYDIRFPFPDSIKIVSQHVDSYGKTRCINIEWKGKKVSIMTTPIQPLPVEIDTANLVHQIDKKKAIELLENIGIVPTSQAVSNNLLVQINSRLGSVDITIPIKGQEEIIPQVELVEEILYPKAKEQSILDVFNRNRKIARYLTEYIFWLFSSYLQEEKIDQITDKVLARFAKKKIKIVDNYEYQGVVGKIFSLDNNLVQGGQLVVQSEEMLKRLMYVLKLYSIQDIRTLRQYYTRRAISQYYVDITDFDRYNSQVILQGEDAIDKWLQESRQRTLILSSVAPSRRLPYFFQNDIIGKNIFLAQNCSSLDQAISLSVRWNRIGINEGLEVEILDDTDMAFQLYNYRHEGDITVQDVKGKKTKQPIRIVGYKISGQPLYTVLLDL